MDTEDIIVIEAVAANRRQAPNCRYAEFRKFCSGGMMVFDGLLLAALYSLLTYRLST